MCQVSPNGTKHRRNYRECPVAGSCTVQFVAATVATDLAEGPLDKSVESARSCLYLSMSILSTIKSRVAAAAATATAATATTPATTTTTTTAVVLDVLQNDRCLAARMRHNSSDILLEGQAVAGLGLGGRRWMEGD